MRVLVVYERTGAGHLRMARVLEAAFASEGVALDSVAGSDLLGSASGGTVAWLWNSLLRRGHYRAADVLVNGAFRTGVLPLLDVAEVDALFANLDRRAPDVLVSTADGYNKALGEYARRRGLPFFVFITDVAVYADLVSPHATHLCYFEETAAAVRSYDLTDAYFARRIGPETGLLTKAGYVVQQYARALAPGHGKRVYRDALGIAPRRNELRAIPIGPLAEPRFFSRLPRAEARARFGAEGAPLLVVANGSAGGPFVVETARQLARGSRPARIVALCGHDTAAYAALARTPAGPRTILPLGYCHEMPALLQAADVVIGRPSAGLLIESLLCGAPFLALGRALSNDLGTWGILRRRGAGEVAETPAELPGALARILDDRAAYVRRIATLTRGTFEDRAVRLRELVLGAGAREDRSWPAQTP